MEFPFEFDLPAERIASHPALPREASKLLIVDRERACLEHRTMHEFATLLDPKDLLVVNETRVIPARLRGAKRSGGDAEALLLRAQGEDSRWWAMVRCSGRLREGIEFEFSSINGVIGATLIQLGDEGEVLLDFSESDPLRHGTTPLPPYIRGGRAEAEDRERYQTLFARVPGSVAAPTAGLHFGRELLAALDARSIERSALVLHVGPGTFRPLRDEDLERGELHAERYCLDPECAAAIDRTRERGGRVVAVGTTSARVLETCATESGRVRPARGETRLFLRPGSRFRVVDALLTNFHLPRSSLLLLVAAFAGSELARDAYRAAIENDYRFYSYGDAMWISG